MLERFRRRIFGQRADDRGFVIAVFALVLTALLVFAGFSIDVGAWYARGSEAQRAADAAALAGVVWMPNFDKAEDAALEAAARNGFTAGGEISISVAPVPGNSRQLSVTISDGQVDQYFSKLVMDDVEITRSATAEYVLPVPLGSPRNFFGTGDLSTGFSEEFLHLSVNTWCTDKVDGDRYQSRYVGNRPYGDSNSNCPSPPPVGGISNAEYRPEGYEMYIEAPADRTYAMDVLLLDPQYRRSNEYDFNLHAGDHDYTFELYYADDTPLDDSDNPLKCSQTYSATTSYDYGPYLGVSEWNRLCDIAAGDPDGRYILRVRNTAGQRFAAGANNYAVVARPVGVGGNGLCDGRFSSDCPRVYGKDAISVMADQDNSIADFYLTEIEPVHAGKTMRITLFDPGEGGYRIRIRRPTGTNSWTNATFSYTSSSGHSGTTSALDVTGSRFNGHSVTIDIDLTGYSPPADNQWWQIQYQFGGDVTDRTTWSVNIVGDPVHLVD